MMKYKREEVSEIIETLENMKDDREIVKRAVTKYGYALRYVSDRLRDDEEIVKLAIKNYSLAIHSASHRIGNDLDMLLLANEYGPIDLNEISDRRLFSNRNLMLKLVSGRYSYRYNTDILLYIDEELLQDYEVLYYISLLKDCDERYMSEDDEVVLFDTESLWKYIPDKLRKLPNLTEWLKSQVDIQKGNGLKLYHNDYDISISFFNSITNDEIHTRRSVGAGWDSWKFSMGT